MGLVFGHIRRGAASRTSDDPDRDALSVKRKINFHRVRAGLWILIGATSFIFGWYDKVTLVWIASLYANVVSDWGAAEAADDRKVTELINEVRAVQQAMQEQLDRIEALLAQPAVE